MQEVKEMGTNHLGLGPPESYPERFWEATPSWAKRETEGKSRLLRRLQTYL